MRVQARAKVNLSLEVEPARADGYHPYRSYATSVSLEDTLTFTRSTHGFTVSVSDGLRDTLVTAAVRAVADALGTPALAVTVDKRIPAGAGLGGGSADAAAALAGAARLLAPEHALDLGALAVGLGTDVPFCLAGGCALLLGRGEIVQPLAPLPPVGMLIAVPPVHVSTAAVFAAFDRIGGAPDTDAPGGTVAAALPECSFRNDLEPAAHAVAPDLGRWKALIEEHAGRRAYMTGSGAGYVCFEDTPGDLDGAVTALSAAGLHATLCTPVDSGVFIDL